jgi:hypothetical protein
MRSWGLAVAVLVLALPASATADYRRLAKTDTSEQGLAVASGQVFGLVTARRDSLSAFGTDGSRRELVRLGQHGELYGIDASPQLVAANTSRGSWLGPLAGPLMRTEPRGETAVTGSTLLALEGDPTAATIVAHDAAGNARQVAALPGRDPAQLLAAGSYVSVMINHEAEDSALLVYEIATGRLAYRLETGPVNYDLGPDGRIVLVGGTQGRVPIQTATPADPQLRTIARLRVMPYIALAGDEIALAKYRTVSQMLLLRLDGTHRFVSGPIGTVTALAYDGTTLAFAAGHCLYGGTGSTGPVTTDGCFDDSPVSHRWRLKGRVARVRVTCRVPVGARCRGELRLEIHLKHHRRTLARRKLDMGPGERFTRLRVPRRHLDLARDPDAFVYVDPPSPSTTP